ncbi:hypothetical protein COHA_005494 [Chlorella ohadii]|uniref:Uncharacterized protein n=1 Tax=Chlorella ohadii TaxID=2649997 RepID=A0AAD5DMZ5_9CHLO|nr:hypothetical protein COHA_005494 [Chlorella ohadii]
MSRGGIQLELRGPALRTRGNKWGARGTIFLSNMRLVFVADKPDGASGLQAFELPLAYISEEDFKQPIFFANNLSGRCNMVEAGAEGPQMIQWTLYFKEGGVGTFIPFFFRSCAYVRSVAGRMQQQQQQAAAAGQQQGYPPAAGGDPPSTPPQQFLQTALVDPSGECEHCTCGAGQSCCFTSTPLPPWADPTRVYLTQPLDSSQQRQDAPKFPAPLV